VASLNSVSCPSPGNCSAAGTYYDDNSGVQGLLLTETAGSWATAVEALPANAPSTEPDPYDGGVGSVSCASPGNCGAVGTEGNLLTQSAGSWATGEAAPLPANTASPGMLLFSVSCPSVGSCMAAGGYGTGSTGEGLLIGGSPAAVELEVSTNGSGSGTVTSTPTGIDCGSTCSASYDAGTSLTLTAVPSARSQFSGWSGGGCSGTGSCQPNTSISDQTVTATFVRVPLSRFEIPEAQPRRCVVPRLRGKTLSAAESAIQSHDCAVGTIRRAFSRLVKKGHVISQSPGPGKRLQPGTSVDLVVSRGRR
jgi:hypothetical protein